MIINPNRTESLIDTLTNLWEASVRATHRFITEDDIIKLTPFVKRGLGDIGTLIIKYENDISTAFMGVESNKIEMLFVAPEKFGKGIGKELVKIALDSYNVKYVDVNEQNTSAVGFYKHIGFEVFERTEVDEQGNPFPIFRMNISNNE